MSRHSKNCTAGSVFTYNEKLKLIKDAGLTGFGTNKARIGQDSQKRFDQCELCLSRITGGAAGSSGTGPMWMKSAAPVCCKEGHIFCRECIIENLMKQKKRNDHASKLLEIQEKEEIHKKEQEIQQEEATKLQNFEKKQLALPESATSNQLLKLEELDEQQRDKAAVIKELTNKDSILRNVAKKEWIKTSFWVPENTPAKSTQQITSSSHTSKLYCPVCQSKSDSLAQKHQIKLKELISLKFNSEIILSKTSEKNNKEEYICWVCSKQLAQQKICVLKACGHVMCKGCAKDYCKDKCSQCGEKNTGIIDLKESGSAYSAHSKVQSSVYQPVFQ